MKDSWYDGTTGLPPLDYAIRNVLNEEFLTLYEGFEFTQSMEIAEGVVVFFDFINFYKPIEIPDKLKLYLRLINLMMEENQN